MVSDKTNINNFGISCDVKFNYANYFKSINDNINNKLIDDDLNNFLGIKDIDINNIKNNNSYLNQKFVLKSLFNDDNILSLSSDEYHAFISDNVNKIDDDLNYIASSFKSYLDKYLNSFITFKAGAMLDLKHNIQLNNPICIVQPTLRFFDNYKSKKIQHVLNFSKFINMYNKNPNEDIFNFSESKELLNILNNPCLFLTITMGNDTPLKTALKYKTGWKSFYNNLRNEAKKYGFNLDHYIKGVEFTKNNRLHIHLLILNVSLDVDKLIEFKKSFEHLLNLASFGYVNDITYLKNNKTYIMKSNKDLKYYYGNNKYKNIKILNKFKLKYDKNKYSNFNLVELEYKSNDDYTADASTKIINYIFKYILKSTPYDKLKKEKHIKRYLLNNCIFWLTGIKKFEISRKLSKLLKSFTNKLYKQRFKFFNSDADLKAYLNNNKIDDVKFDRGFISSDDIDNIYTEYPFTALGLYTSLGLDITGYLNNIRFKTHFIYSDNLGGGSDGV